MEFHLVQAIGNMKLYKHFTYYCYYCIILPPPPLLPILGSFFLWRTRSCTAFGEVTSRGGVFRSCERSDVIDGAFLGDVRSGGRERQRRGTDCGERQTASCSSPSSRRCAVPCRGAATTTAVTLPVRQSHQPERSEAAEDGRYSSAPPPVVKPQWPAAEEPVSCRGRAVPRLVSDVLTCQGFERLHFFLHYGRKKQRKERFFFFFLPPSKAVGHRVSCERLYFSHIFHVPVRKVN